MSKTVYVGQDQNLERLQFVIKREIEADKSDAFVRVRIVQSGKPSVCRILALGADYMQVNEGGNVRYVNLDRIDNIQFVTGDENYPDSDMVPVNGEVTSY
jgi:hypothetical protein